MSHKYIRNCSWGYKCEKSWENLIETKNNKIKFCSSCQREVHQCDSKEDIIDNIKLNRCIYFYESMLHHKNRNIDEIHDRWTNKGHRLLGSIMPPGDDDTPF